MGDVTHAAILAMAPHGAQRMAARQGCKTWLNCVLQTSTTASGTLAQSEETLAGQRTMAAPTNIRQSLSFPQSNTRGAHEMHNERYLIVGRERFSPPVPPPSDALDSTYCCVVIITTFTNP